MFLLRAVERQQLPPETVAFLALPIEVNRQTIGVLACHRIRSRQRHLADDMAVLKILATLAGQLLQLQGLVQEKTRTIVSCQAPSVAAHLPSTRMALLQSLPMHRAWAAARA